MSNDVSIPDQIFNPDWAEVKELAKQAAAATLSGDMETANDMYQYLAIEVMSALYGPNAVSKFIKYAMDQEQESPSLIVLS